MKLILTTLLVLLAVGYAIRIVMCVLEHARGGSEKTPSRNPWMPTWHHLLIGFVTNFFDTLGIGNFAPTTAWFRHAKLVPDHLIPATMNVGHALPVVLMALLYIEEVEIESTTLVSTIGSAIIGAWLGAGIVSNLPRQLIQLGMALALLVAATLMAAFLVGGEPSGNDALSLEGTKLVIACLTIFLLGALMTIGVGLYAPCMILVSLLGMNPKAAFPIMMGACAYLMPIASLRFLNSRKLDLQAALGLTLGGWPAVLIAALIVKSLPLGVLKWLVIAVVVLTAFQMLQAAASSHQKHDQTVD